MINLNFLNKIFGSTNERKIKSLESKITEINNLEDEISKLNDAQLKEKTEELRSKVKEPKDLDIVLPTAFALVREASKRTIGQRHYDVQLMGGMILHQGLSLIHI